MPQTRKLVRDAIRSALADPVGGFNVKLAAIAPSNGIDAFAIDWSVTGSENFLQSQVDQAGAESSRLLNGINVVLYTSTSRQVSGQERAKFKTFDGTIQAHVDFHLEFTDGENVTDDLTESYADAVEDAVIQVLLDPAGSQAFRFQGPVYFNGDFLCAKEPIRQTSGGYAQRLPFTLLYEVSV